MNIPEMPNKRKVADEINRLMDAKNVNVQNLSDAIGRPRTTIYNIKNGHASYDLLKKTLDTLDKWEVDK